MKNRYEGLLVLNTKGNEESAKEIIERLEGEFKKEGADVEQVQRMDRRTFSYVAGPLDSRLFREFRLRAPSRRSSRSCKRKFKLDADVYRQHYQKLPSKPSAAKKDCETEAAASRREFPRRGQCAACEQEISKMANLNKVMLIGNLTRDPEIKYTPKGTAIADLGLAVNRVYIAETGEKREEVDVHRRDPVGPHRRDRGRSI